MKQTLLFLTALFAALLAFPAEYYVDAARADDSGTATSWATAKKTIQAAVDLASDGDTVWVTNGVYDTGGAVTPGYALSNRVCITNAITVQSVNGADVTIIKGAAGSNGSNDVDSVRGVYMRGGSSLFGFTISDATTMASGNETFDCSAAGVFLHSGGTLNNCILRRNSANESGGGVWLNSGGTVNNCLLTGNSADGYNAGGGAYMGNGGVLNNCTVFKNAATRHRGGGLFLTGAGVVNNCIVWGNSSISPGSDMRRNGYYHRVRYTCAGDGVTHGSEGCITNNPLLENAESNNFQLQTPSQCINAGNNSYAPTNVSSYDLGGDARILGGIVDMGAYESTTTMYEIITTVGTKGSITPQNPWVLKGHDQSILIQPDWHYRIESVVVDGFSVPVSSSCAFTNVQSNHTLAISFVWVPQVLTVEDGVGDGAYTNGTIVQVISSPAPAEKVFYRWTTEPLEYTNHLADAFASSTTFTMPPTNVTLTANYASSPRVNNDGFTINQLNTSKSNMSFIVMGEDVALVRSPSGETYIFEPSVDHRNVWEEKTRLVAGDRTVFGSAAFATRDVVVFGNSGDSTGGTDAGAAYVFERNAGGSNVWGEAKKLRASDSYQHAWFGSSVVANDDTVVVGAPGMYRNGVYFVGAVYIFERDAGGTNAWGEVKKFTGNWQGDQFGTSLAFDGERLVVGGKGGFGSSGKIHIYERNNGGSNAWGLVRNKVDPDTYTELATFFGSSVSMSKDTVIVSAGWTDYPGYSASGAAYIYEKDAGGNNMWGVTKTLRASVPKFHGGFGSKVLISGDLAVANDGATTCVFGRNIGGANAWGEADQWDASSFIYWDSLIGIKTNDANGVCFITSIDSDGATDVTPHSATLRGGVVDTGGETPGVTIYWGDNDGETNSTAWDHAELMGSQDAGFSKAISGLISNTVYYYRCCASNSAGSTWAESTESFVYRIFHSIATTAGENGTITPENPVIIEGTDQLFSIQPDLGYRIDSLTVDGTPVPEASSYLFTNVQSTHTIAATFVLDPQALTVENGYGDGSYTNGALIPVTADVASNGYGFAGWEVEPVEYTNRLADAFAASTSFTMPTTNVTLTATYRLLYPITTTVGVNGSIDPENPLVLQGFDKQFLIHPAIGYRINSLSVDGSPILEASIYTFTNVQSAHTISATFIIDPKVLTVENGSGDGSYTNGEIIAVTANVMPEGYAFVGWSTDPVEYTNRFADILATSTTFTMPATNVALTANYLLVSTYADASKPNDSGDGTSWATAKRTIQSAVDIIPSGGTVWVTNGVYDMGGAVAPGLALNNRVCITKPITVQSVNGSMVTVIKGAAGSNGGRDDDATRCVYMENGAVLIGFTLRKGYTSLYGGSFDMSGGGAFLKDGGVLNNCIIKENSAGFGGGVYCNGGGTLNNCRLIKNSAYSGGGGVHLSFGGSLNNCTLSGNSGFNGGGVYLYNGGALNNCILWGNTASSSGNDIYKHNSGSVIRHTCASDGLTHGVNGCITSNPLFEDGVNNDFRLQGGSPGSFGSR